MQELDAIHAIREYRAWSRTLDQRMGPISLMTIHEWTWKDFKRVLSALHEAYLSPSPKGTAISAQDVRKYQRLNRQLKAFLTGHPAYCPPVASPSKTVSILPNAEPI